MTKRDELFSLFGPKLTEAFMKMVLEELNFLRAKHDLSPRTELQVYDQITNHHSDLEDYSWMDFP